MKTQTQLEVKKPCIENFRNFKKTNVGGFCNSCSKDVIDFTKMTSNEIIAHFKIKNNNNTCGRFFKNQLDFYPKETNKNRFSFLGGLGLALFSFFTFGSLIAQDVIVQKEIKQLKKELLVKGTVTDEQNPLPGVSILLKGTNKGTQTDFDGKFTFPTKLKEGDILIFSYLGYKPKNVIITKHPKNSNLAIDLNINFNEDLIILMGKVAVKKIYSSKKKF